MKMLAVGDVFLGDQLARFGFGVRSLYGESGYARCFEGVIDMTAGHDVVFANLESALGLPSDTEASVRNLMNRGHHSGAAALRAAGIGIVSLANNHSFEHGPAGLERTTQLLDSAGVEHVGTVAHPVAVLEAPGLRVAFLGWSMIPDAHWPNLDPGAHYHVTHSIDAIIDEVMSLRGHVDRVVLGIHWGNEYVDAPSVDQQAVAHRLLDAGVDVLLGHHPHVVQPVERRGGGIIAYSLGNFVFDVWSDTDRRGVALSVDLRSMASTIIPLELSPVSFGPSIARSDRSRGSLAMDTARTQRLSLPEAAGQARAARAAYRRKLTAFGLRNIHRYAKKRELSGLVVRRAAYLIRHRQAARTDPHVVYRAPLK